MVQSDLFISFHFFGIILHRYDQNDHILTCINFKFKNKNFKYLKLS